MESVLALSSLWIESRTTDTQWRHKSKISEKLGRCGRQKMLPPYLKIWEWEWIFGRAVKAISSLGVRSPCTRWYCVAVLCQKPDADWGRLLSFTKDTKVTRAQKEVWLVVQYILGHSKAPGSFCLLCLWPFWACIVCILSFCRDQPRTIKMYQI